MKILIALYLILQHGATVEMRKLSRNKLMDILMALFLKLKKLIMIESLVRLFYMNTYVGNQKSNYNKPSVRTMKVSTKVYTEIMGHKLLSPIKVHFYKRKKIYLFSPVFKFLDHVKA